MKASYIISIIIAIIAFCGLYLGLDLNVIFSIFISLGSYYALTLIFNRNEVLQERIDLERLEYEQLTAQASNTIKQIKGLEGKIENSGIQSNISQICETSDKILLSLKEKPKKMKQVRKFVDYYLPFTLKILDRVENQSLTSQESIDFMERVERMLGRVKMACEAQLNNMYDLDIIDTNADIKVFETMLKTDGLVDNNMNIIDVKKEGE